MQNYDCRSSKAFRAIVKLAVLIMGVILLYSVITRYSGPGVIKGVIWQPTNDYPEPEGNWHLLGADTLLVQWSLNDGLSWIMGSGFDSQPFVPDWSVLLENPWAQQLILGLASNMKLEEARANSALLADQSRSLAQKLNDQLPIIGWYAPIEISPDWNSPNSREDYLAALPRPLYISVYGGYEMTPQDFASWVASWSPDDTQILLQDGVGAAGQTPQQARARADALGAILGTHRVIMIMEAFQPDTEDGFHAAGLSQMINQIWAYEGLEVYVFSARYLGRLRVLFLYLISPWLKGQN